MNSTNSLYVPEIVVGLRLALARIRVARFFAPLGVVLARVEPEKTSRQWPPKNTTMPGDPTDVLVEAHAERLVVERLDVVRRSLLGGCDKHWIVHDEPRL